jgi:hypothetical protein
MPDSPTARTTRNVWRSEAQGVSIQVAILKVLASHDSGRATTASLKRDIAILATSGPEWGARMRRLSGRVGTIDILASGYVLCDRDGWQITAAGRDFLRALEAVTQDNRPFEVQRPALADGEGNERPRAELIVVGHRFRNRQRLAPASPERQRSRAKPDAVG